MRKFPSIDQLRNAIRNVNRRSTYVGRDEAGEPIFDQSRAKPVLTYRGTVKLHGTNAGIVFKDSDKSIQYQSRERVLTLEQDNAGFALYMMGREDVLRGMFRNILDANPEAKEIAIYGEWCGQGIQKGVAISEVPKMFVIFGVKLFTEVEVQTDDEADPNAVEVGRWIDFAGISALAERIFNILDFPTWEIEIDFARPEFAQARLSELTEAVEAECPVGKAFGVSGVGEGIVWTPIDPTYRTSQNWFKVKGEKHSVTKVRTLAAVDVEAAQSIYEFVDRTITDERLEQGVYNLVNEQQKPLEMTSMGDFLRWVFNDVMKEERDTIVASGIDPKKLGGPIANRARPWYVSKVNATA